MALNNKRILSGAKKSSGHVGVQESSGSILDLHPKFSLEFLRKPYCLSDCSKEEQAAFAQRLHELSQLPWKEIFRCDKHKQGCEDLTDAKFSIGKPDLLEGKKIIAFRFKGKAPMVGYREREIFYVIWLDRNFTLYNH